jgi:hypothetical protein
VQAKKAPEKNHLSPGNIFLFLAFDITNLACNQSLLPGSEPKMKNHEKVLDHCRDCNRVVWLRAS